MKNPAMRLTHDQIATIVDALRPLDCVVIYLFGSFGGPAERGDSDMDIAFLPQSPIDSLDCFDMANRLADRLGRAVDLVDLSQASTVMAKEVLRTGTPLFIADTSIHQEFEMRVLADYARLNEERQPVLIG
jgi:predicted nucleotidyltransferase